VCGALWGDGLRKFERLAARPAFARERYDGRTFVIEEKSRFGLAVVHFKVCPVLRYQRCGFRSDKQQKDRLLLAMLDDMEEPGFDVWDTPNPPDLSLCPVRPIRSIQQCATTPLI
jgi:hypothetical protein